MLKTYKVTSENEVLTQSCSAETVSLVNAEALLQRYRGTVVGAKHPITPPIKPGIVKSQQTTSSAPTKKTPVLPQVPHTVDSDKKDKKHN